MKRKNTFSIIAVILLVAAGMALRVSCMGNLMQESVYYDMAKVAEGQGISGVAHTAVYVYVQLLNLLFRVFGNKFEAAIWLQIVLQVIAGCFVYSGVRKPAGIVSAVIALGVLMLSPWGINQSLILSPGSLLFFVFSMTVFSCAKCIEKGKRVLKIITSALLLAVAVYLYLPEILSLSMWKFGDWLSIELLILLIVLIGSCTNALFTRRKTTVERVWEDGKMEACLEAIGADSVEWEPVDECEEETTPEPQVKFIENPLPLPKKHVKKVLDYDRELEDGQDDFDIEIDENDDFDL